MHSKNILEEKVNIIFNVLKPHQTIKNNISDNIYIEVFRGRSTSRVCNFYFCINGCNELFNILIVEPELLGFYLIKKINLEKLYTFLENYKIIKEFFTLLDNIIIDEI